MANFQPLKDRFLGCLDKHLKQINRPTNFLDFGCGRADIAAHLINEHSIKGDLLEVEPKSIEAIKNNSLFSESLIFENLDSVPNNHYDLIVAFDVLEHLSNPLEVMQQLNSKLTDGGYIAIIVPYRQSTWGWDDDYYGHLRRWSKKEFVQAIEQSNLKLLSILDPTFPVYRFIRFSMLKISSPPVQDYDLSKDKLENYQERSQMSPHENPWKNPPKIIKYIPWKLLNRMSVIFEKCFFGDEIFAWCQKK